VAVKEKDMLGPALTHLLQMLSSIKDEDRTEEQKAVYTELRALFLAFPPPSEDRRHLNNIERLLAHPDMKLFSSILEPYKPPAPSGQKCNNCGQNFPVTTQPSGTR
jgi:hypothetical protein